MLINSMIANTLIVVVLIQAKTMTSITSFYLISSPTICFFCSEIIFLRFKRSFVKPWKKINHLDLIDKQETWFSRIMRKCAQGLVSLTCFDFSPETWKKSVKFIVKVRS